MTIDSKPEVLFFLFFFQPNIKQIILYLERSALQGQSNNNQRLTNAVHDDALDSVMSQASRKSKHEIAFFLHNYVKVSLNGPQQKYPLLIWIITAFKAALADSGLW